MIGFGQIKVINSNSEPIPIGSIKTKSIGGLTGEGEDDAIMKLQRDGEFISILYDRSFRDYRRIIAVKMDYKLDTKVDIIDEENTLNDLYGIIVDGFASLPKKNDIECRTKEGNLLPLSLCKDGYEYYIVNEVTLDIGNSNFLTLQWKGNKKKKVGSMRFVYKGNYSMFLTRKMVDQLFNK